MKYFLSLLSVIFLGFSAHSRQNQNLEELSETESIKINQIGFYPGQPKMAVIPEDAGSDNFLVLEKETQKVAYTGSLSESRSVAYSDKKTRIADFSAFNEEGEYVVAIPGYGKSFPFKVEEGNFKELGKATIKAFYYQRVSTELPEEFAGNWARPAGHPDDKVRIHASAQSDQRPEGTIISAPFGWYDAGDYNKYIVNSGITVGTLLSLYEDFPDYFAAQNLNIPESGNDVPDLLDELMWNLRWMVNMQDPNDGGVYHKLTTADFEGMVMPHLATNQRYVVAKGTAATLDFAAVMAQASRVYQEFHPESAKTYLDAAEKAWKWAEENPDILYTQNELNKLHQPKINTGAYGDRSVADERIWAAAELYITTKNPAYLEEITAPKEGFQLPNWGNVSWVGYYSLLRHQDKLQAIPTALTQQIQSALMQQADDYITGMENTSHHTVMGQTEKDFNWGSNSNAANQGIALIQAYMLSSEKKYLEGAFSNLDYILGRNATGYSFVTGFGDKSPQYPHHRPSEAEPEKDPVPGFLVGGPNSGQQDKCNYPSNIPDESYVDETCSYASNEIAINWNAPMAYLVNALEAIHLD